MRGLITNRYPGACIACRARVEVNAGYAYKAARWVTVCTTPECLAKVLPAEALRELAGESSCGATASVPRITAAGEVWMSKNDAALPLLRAFPGSRWQRDRGCWTVSLEMADRPRVLEIAAQLKLQIDPELARIVDAPHVAAAVERATAAGAYPFQLAGVRALASHDRFILADDMGCVDGDAIIHASRRRRGFKITLAQLYKKFNSKRWESFPTSVRALCDGELRQHRISKILFQGRKQTLLLTLQSGKSIRVTPDHEIAVAPSEFVRADALYPGCPVLTNGIPACRECGSTERVAMSATAKFRGYCRTCIYTKKRDNAGRHGEIRGRWKDKDGYIRVSGHTLHPRHTTGGVYEHILVAESMLGRPLEEGEQVHHINRIKDDNRPENLRVLTIKEHRLLHTAEDNDHLKFDGHVGKSGDVIRFIPVQDHVASIEDGGLRDVYDIVCEDPHRNFVANGIIVHNCGKTIQSLMALDAARGTLVVCPSSLKLNWSAECKRWRPDLTPVVLSGRGSFRFPTSGEVVITNYDILPDWAAEVETADPELYTSARSTILVADEAHRAKNYKAKRSKRVTGLASVCAKTWFLTGTPLENKPLDLWGVLSAGAMQRTVFGSWKKFTAVFGGYKDRFGWRFGAPTVEAPERLRRVMLRRLKSDVLPELPPKQYKDFLVDPDAGIRKMLDKAWLEYLHEQKAERAAEVGGQFSDDEMEEGDEDPGDKLPHFSRFSELRQALAASRVAAMLEYVEDCEAQDVPLLVFSAHRAPIDALAEREGWAVITGDTKVADRQSIVEAFQAGRLKGVGLTITAGGVGLTLTHASHVLFVDLDWTPSNNVQAEDRVCRIGQTASGITIVRMVTDHPLDRHVHRLLVSKMAVIEAAIEARVQFEPAAEVTTATDWTEVERIAADLDHKATLDAIERKATHMGLRPVPLTDEQVVAVKLAWSMMLARCDGALERDGVGFNKPDARLAHWMMPVIDNVTATQIAFATLRKYRRQLAEEFPSLYPEA